MKARLCLALSLILYINLQQAWSSPNDYPIYGCLATCLAFNPGTQSVSPLGYARSESNRDIQEAFALMEQGCRYQAEDHGYSPQILLVSDIESFSLSSEFSKSFRTSTWAQAVDSKSGVFAFRADSSSQSSNSHRQSFYKVKTVGLEVCMPFRRNPKARSYYTGPGRPLG
jgi:hypothetical protein